MARRRRHRGFGGFRSYVSASERRAQASRKMAELRSQGRDLAPITIAGSKITTTFWGHAWCQNLERYSDYENRLPRGRTYVRNGSVIDLQINEGTITALVSGTDIYEVTLGITTLPTPRWRALQKACSGEIASVLDLLKGNLSDGVMSVVTREREGLFPTPDEITLACSCPDWATMCKHVAAVLYGVGARLDRTPHLLFTLRGVDPEDLVAEAITATQSLPTGGHHKRLTTDNLSSIFGIDIEERPQPKRRKAKAKTKTKHRKAKAKTQTQTQRKTKTKRKAKTKHRKPQTERKAKTKRKVHHES